MNNFRRYYHVSDKLQEDFIQVPQLLFKLPQYRLMNSDAKLLYGVLRNRIKLSIQNQWIDENNRVYMYYTREQMAEMLSVSLPTIRKAIKQLLDKELLQEERQGLNRPNRLYLLKIQTPLAEEAFSDNLDSDGYSDSEDIYKSGQLNTDSENMQKFTYLDRKDVSPGQKKSFTPDSKVFAPKKKENRKKDLKNSIPPIFPPTKEREKMVENVKQMIEFSSFVGGENEKIVKAIINVIADILMCQSEYYRIGPVWYDMSGVKKAFSQVKKDTILFTINAIKSNGRVEHFKSYVTAVIYNAMQNTILNKSYLGSGTKSKWLDFNQRNYDYDELMDIIRKG